MGDPDAADAPLASLAEGRLSDALVQLLGIWDSRRDPVVAGAIESLGRALEPVRPKLGSSPRFHADWLARDAERHPADVVLLAESLRSDQPGRARFQERVVRLLERPADPRVFGVVLERVKRGVYPELGPLYDKLLRHHADPRAVDALEMSRREDAWDAKGWERRFVKLRKLLESFDASAVEGAERLGPAIEAALRRPRDAWLTVAPERGDAVLDDLWDGVLANPADDAARLVFADRVAEASEDHAVFIQLQLAATSRSLTKAEEKRMAAIQKAEHGRLLGPLAGSVNTKGARFVRGFLDAGNVITGSAVEARELGERPHWRTASALWSKHVELYLGAGVSDLRSAGCRFVEDAALGRWIPNPGGAAVDSLQLRKLAKLGPHPWRVLQITATISHLDRLAEDLPKLRAPRLETLVLVGAGVPAEVLDVLPPVRELVVQPGTLDPADVIASQPGLERFQMSGLYVLRRVEPGVWALDVPEPTVEERRLIGPLTPDDGARLRARLAAVVSAAGHRIVEDA